MRFGRVTAVLIVAAGIAAAETQKGTVQSAGRAIPGATVTVFCGAERNASVTDDAGRFEVGGLPATPCRFSVGMFGFEPSQQDATASAQPLTFNLQLQTRATLAQEPAGPGRGAGGGRGGFRRPAIPGGPVPPGDAGGRGAGRGGLGRGGFPQVANGAVAGPGRGGRAAPSPEFQNLSLLQNGDNPADAPIEEVAPTANAPAENGGANEAFLVNGSLSQGVQPQPGDGFGLGPLLLGGGPGGIFGGPGGGAPGFGDGGAPAGAVVVAGPGGGPGGGGFGGGGGGRGGFGGGGGRGGPGRGGPPPNRNVQFGNRINRGRGRQFQGSIFETIGNSVLNARPYSFTAPVLINGQPVPKSGYASNRFGFSAGGPLSIPHLFSSDKTFWFLNYTGGRSKNPVDRVSTVPTAAQRLGDFSGTPYAAFSIAPSRIDPAAAGLLKLIPLPNAPGLRNNYQLLASNPADNDNLQARINQTLTGKDRLDVNFNYQHRDASNIQSFGFLDPSNGYGLNTTLNWSRTFSRALINNLTWNFSRNLNQNLSSFSYGSNIAGLLGITGVSTNPAFYGPPTISFANFGTLGDGSPSLNRAQTVGLNDVVISIRGRHTSNFGFSLQRRQNNQLSNPNGRGTFNFTGINTGYDFADFLLGLPQQASVARYADPSRYLRETTLSAFASDDWRMRAGLTINAGLRWEYFGPFTEKYGRMANLDFAPGLRAVAVVPAGQSGPYSGSFPQGLINPDYKLFSPRVGIAWRPWKDRQVIARAGYGVYFNGSVYGQFGNQLTAQPPFAQTYNLQTSSAAPLTLENGFPLIPSQAIASTFAVDKNYRPAYAQTWNAALQQSFGRAWVMEGTYTGTKGTRLDVLRIPNRAPLGSGLNAQNLRAISNASAFTFDSAVGNSILHSGQVRFTRRFARGTAFNVLYTLSKSIDNASTLGSGPVQNDLNIAGERALSSFDQRHNLRVNFNFQSPVGANRTGLRADLLRGWTVAGTLTATSGTPFTATVPGDPSGTGFTGTSRAQATGAPVSGGDYFNLSAFTVPANGTFGNAGRNTIPGIANFSVTASFFRSFKLDDKRRIEFRLDSTNPINHVNVSQINTTVGTVNYGLPVGAGGMRTMNATVRLRF